MNLVVPTEQLGAASVPTQMVTVFDKKVSRWSSSTRQWLPDVVRLHEYSSTSWTAHVQLYKTNKKKPQHHTSYDSKARPSAWPGCRTCFVHDINTSTGVLHCCFKGGKRHAQHMDSWAVQQMSHWGEFSSGQGNTRLKPLHMTCWGFTEQVGGGRRTSWSPGASPEEAGAHVEAPLSHPVITPSLFLILGYVPRSRARLFIPENNVALCKMEYLTLCLQPPKKSSLFQLPARTATLLDLPSVSGKKNNRNN